MGRQACKVGVDEAGRGPVLGPMVYGAVAIAEEAEAELRNSSYNDSKKLSEKERESLRNDIDVDERLTCSTVSVPAERISESMLRYGSKGSLNDIAFDATVDCVRQLITLGIHVSSILTDAVRSPHFRYQWSCCLFQITSLYCTRNRLVTPTSGATRLKMPSLVPMLPLRRRRMQTIRL
jgi:ribonuclease H2 subunit A